ncbi:uncharacterized protein LOC125483498 [Rhincodon typus]|uniref:uncharacterized protein LOC125483498 n=1 Tax=Rhincodon typus TaxID=259920 RepID=UPI0020306B40|nr:uncharacterized protein LOC125483498 [Rhincodon typus]
MGSLTILKIIIGLSIVHTVSGLEDNLFYKTHILLHGNRTVCYPLAQSVEALFVATPGWNPHQLYEVDYSGEPCQGKRGTWSRGVQAKCVELISNGPSNCTGTKPQSGKEEANCTDPNSYPLCFNGTGSCCVYALVNITDHPHDASWPHQCVKRTCTTKGGLLSCPCLESKPVNMTSGIHWTCGSCNGTHVETVYGTFLFHSSDFQPFKGQSSWNSNKIVRESVTCYRAKKGFVFLLNGTFSTATPTLPVLFAVGTVGPLMVPCPQRAYTQRRIVTRFISKEFCADWQDPVTLRSSLGHGFLGTVTLGGSSGVVSAKNFNYLICGLTALANSTMWALEAVNQKLAELQLYAQRTRYAVDYQLAEQGGVCTIVGDKCITHVTDESYNITHAIQSIKKQLEDVRQGPKKGDDWLWWLLGGSWGSYLLHGLVIFVVIIIVCCVFITCLNTGCKILTNKLAAPFSAPI